MAKLDQIADPTWQALRDWVTEYSGTWNRIHLFFEAYNEALLTDPAVAATAIPNTYRVTSNMTCILSRFVGEERERVHEKLVIFLSMASQMLSLSRAQGEDFNLTWLMYPGVRVMSGRAARMCFMRSTRLQ